MRKRLPAYAKGLLERRRAGEHPLDVDLCYGVVLRRTRTTPMLQVIPSEFVPMLQVIPSEFVPGLYDWSVLTGLCVTVFAQELIDWHPNVVTNHRAALHAAHFAVLCAELTEADALVMIDVPQLTGGRIERRRELLLDMTKRLAGVFMTSTDKLAWPSWWSDVLQKKQEQAAAAYLHDIEKACAGEK